MPSRYSSAGMRSDTSTPQPPSKYSTTRFSDVDRDGAVEDLQHGAVEQALDEVASFLLLAGVLELDLARVDASTACRSVMRGTISRSPQRTARFSAFAISVS